MQNPVQPTTSLTIAAVTYELPIRVRSCGRGRRNLLTALCLPACVSAISSTPTISLVRAMLFACAAPTAPP